MGKNPFIQRFFPTFQNTFGWSCCLVPTYPKPVLSLQQQLPAGHEQMPLLMCCTYHQVVCARLAETRRTCHGFSLALFLRNSTWTFLIRIFRLKRMAVKAKGHQTSLLWIFCSWTTPCKTWPHAQPEKAASPTLQAAFVQCTQAELCLSLTPQVSGCIASWKRQCQQERLLCSYSILQEALVTFLCGVELGVTGSWVMNHSF